MGTFEGFRPEVADFFDDLREHNTKAWFDEHRDVWTELVRVPLEGLLAEAQTRYGDGRIMRQNRDVRFSKDKSPYRLHASMWAGSVGGVYLTVDATGLQVGGGLYEPSRDQLARARTVIDERPQAGTALRTLLDALTGDGFEVAGPSLATAPRGYPRDHPRIELLRLQHYAALVHLPLTSPLPDILGAWERIEPLNRWAERWIGPAESWP